MMGQAHEIHGLLQGLDTKARVFWGRREQGITNTLGLPIDKMLYIYLLCPHAERRKKTHSNLNTFTKETSSPNGNQTLSPKKPVHLMETKHFHQRNQFT